MSCVLASASACRTLPSVQLSVRLFRLQLFFCFFLLRCFANFPAAVVVKIEHWFMACVCVCGKRGKNVYGCAGGGALGGKQRFDIAAGPAWWRWCWWAGIVFDMLRAHMQVADIPSQPRALSVAIIICDTHTRAHTQTQSRRRAASSLILHSMAMHFYNNHIWCWAQHEQKIVNAIRRA